MVDSRTGLLVKGVTGIVHAAVQYELLRIKTPEAQVGGSFQFCPDQFGSVKPLRSQEWLTIKKTFLY